VDITQQDYDYFISAYQAVKTAGPDKHLPCSPDHKSGYDRATDRSCAIHILVKAFGSAGILGISHLNFKAAWCELFGEGITYTNERGYETVCESFDYLISHYAPLFTPDYAPTGEPEPIMGLA
jgi:hypothetical protein